MTKSITDIAREAGALTEIRTSLNVDGDSILFMPEELEAFAAAIKAAHIEELLQKRDFPEGTFAFDPTDFLYQKGLHDAKTELLAGVEMPEPFVAVIDTSTAGHQSWDSLSYYTADQMREYASAAALSWAAETDALTAERDALRAEVERLKMQLKIKDATKSPGDER
jgi:uncharacterized small protein (DUF1192 family)